MTWSVLLNLLRVESLCFGSLDFQLSDHPLIVMRELLNLHHLTFERRSHFYDAGGSPQLGSLTPIPIVAVATAVVLNVDPIHQRARSVTVRPPVVAADRSYGHVARGCGRVTDALLFCGSPHAIALFDLAKVEGGAALVVVDRVLRVWRRVDVHGRGEHPSRSSTA